MKVPKATHISPKGGRGLALVRRIHDVAGRLGVPLLGWQSQAVDHLARFSKGVPVYGDAIASIQDMSVAAEASRMESRARAEAAEEQREQGGDEASPAPGEESPAEVRAAEHFGNPAANPMARAAQTYAEISESGREASSTDATPSLLELFG